MNAVFWKLSEENVSVNRKGLNFAQMPLGWSGVAKTMNLPLNLVVWRSLVTLITVVYGWSGVPDWSRFKKEWEEMRGSKCRKLGRLLA